MEQIDLPASQPERIAEQLQATFGLKAPFLRISAKTGEGVDEVLETIVKRIPPPKQLNDPRLKAFLFDSL